MAPIEPQPVTADRLPLPDRRRGADRFANRRACLIENLAHPPIPPEETGQLTDPAHDLGESFRPRNGWQDWLAGAIAALMGRIDQCGRVERQLRDWASYRAIDFWDEDQALEAETLGAKLGRNPARVVAQLRQTPAGCDWLLKRWHGLAQIRPDAWTDDQRALAGQLAGDSATAAEATAAGLIAVQLRNLQAQRERVEEGDALLRGLVASDLCDDKVAGLARLRRYARSLHQQMIWYVDQFDAEPLDHRNAPRREPSTVAPALPIGTLPQPPAGNQAPIDPVTDETKPFLLEPAPKTAETKPFVRVGLMARLAEAAPQVVAGSPSGQADCRNHLPRSVARERRVNRDANAAHRQKTARRREALGCPAAW